MPAVALVTESDASTRLVTRGGSPGLGVVRPLNGATSPEVRAVAVPRAALNGSSKPRDVAETLGNANVLLMALRGVSRRNDVAPGSCGLGAVGLGEYACRSVTLGRLCLTDELSPADSSAR